MKILFMEMQITPTYETKEYLTLRIMVKTNMDKYVCQQIITADDLNSRLDHIFLAAKEELKRIMDNDDRINDFRTERERGRSVIG
jgi:hypothetical protein